MLHTTKGIVLRNVKYGDTSLIVSVYTELFGMQSYLINGVRTEKKSSSKANIYQPTTLLEMVVYHHPHKNLQRIKEAKLFTVKNFQGAVVIKYSIGIYMVELIQKAITETESNAELYHFFEASFLFVLNSNQKSLSDFPILFTLQFADHLGFGVQNNYSEATPYFNLHNGNFMHENDVTPGQHVDKEQSLLLSDILHNNGDEVMMTGSKRLELLHICLQYLQIHIPQLPELKSVSVLHEILN